MIDPKIREAWQSTEAFRQSVTPEYRDRSMILADAYVNAEARARRAEWQLDDGYEWQDLAVERWTLADWEKAVREELEKP